MTSLSSKYEAVVIKNQYDFKSPSKQLRLQLHALNWPICKDLKNGVVHYFLKIQQQLILAGMVSSSTLKAILLWV